MARRSAIERPGFLPAAARLILVLGVSIGFAGVPAWSIPSAARPGVSPSDAYIRRLLIQRIDHDKQSIGIVVGVVGARDRRILSYGSLDQGDKRPLDGNTLFEIGSITKLFTALLMTDMARHGEVRFDDPVAKYLPSTLRVPERNGRQITLVDLATHTSGLPLMPGNFRPKNPENPYADYTEDKLYQFMASYQLTSEIGLRYEYSNLGYGLLGQALARRAGVDYETLIETRICEPLAMRSTRITLTPALQKRLATGHSADLLSVSGWDNPMFPGAGALRSSANDLAGFLSAMMGFTRSRLAPSMTAMLSMTRPTDQPSMDAALGWTVDTRNGARIIWRNGRTGGYRAFIGFSPGSGIGIVVLSNTNYGNFGVDDIGLHLLDARYPLTESMGSAADEVTSSDLRSRADTRSSTQLEDRKLQ